MTRKSDKNKNDDLIVGNSKCNLCNGEVFIDDRSLKCTICTKLFHQICLKLDRKEYDKFKKMPVWFCSKLCESTYNENKSKEFDIPENPTNRDIMTAIINLQSSQNFLSHSYDDLKVMVENLVTTVKTMDVRLKKLENEKQVLIEELQNERKYNGGKTIDNQEELKNNVVISGISNECTNLVSAVVDLGNGMDVNLGVTQGDFLTVERLFIQKDEVPDDKKIKRIPIVAVFKDFETKVKYLQARKQKKVIYSDECKFPGDNTKIFVQDQLSKYNQSLLKSARQLRVVNAIKYAWVQNSKVLVRKDDDSKILWIRNMFDLTQFNDGHNSQANTN